MTETIQTKEEMDREIDKLVQMNQQFEELESNQETSRIL